MYLSRIELDIYNRKKMRDLKDLNSIHGFVESCFPEEIREGKRTRKLWRIDNLKNKKYLIILSEGRPDCQKIEKYAVKGSYETKDYDQFLDKLEEGMKARFRIKMNTVKAKLSKDNSKRGRIVPVADEELSKFFLDRTEKNGFSVGIDEFGIFEKELLPYKTVGKQQYNLVSASFEGNLMIIDHEKIKESLTKGIGKKKAYGFGLLTIIPYEK